MRKIWWIIIIGVAVFLLAIGLCLLVDDERDTADDYVQSREYISYAYGALSDKYGK